MQMCESKISRSGWLCGLKCFRLNIIFFRHKGPLENLLKSQILQIDKNVKNN